MATLLETLQKNLGSVGVSQGPIEDETALVRKLTAGKKGLVGAPTGPTGLNLAEVAARGQTAQQLGQVGETAQQVAINQRQAAAAQAEQQKQAEQALAGQREESKLRTRIQTENILRNLEQSGKEMDERERAAGMEQVAGALRFQNNQYIRDLTRNAEKENIKDANKFNEKLAESVFADNQALLKSRLGQQAVRDISDRDFTKELAKMDINEAVRMAKENSVNAQRGAVIQGTGELAKTGISVYGRQQAGGFDEKYNTYAETTREQGGSPVSYTRWKQRQAESGSTFVGPTREQAGR